MIRHILASLLIGFAPLSAFADTVMPVPPVASGAAIIGTPTTGNCTSWSSAIAVGDSGAPCAGSSTWFPAYVSNNWYLTPYAVPLAGAALGAGTIYCGAVPLLQNVTIKTLGVRIQTPVASGNVGVAIYASSGGLPSGSTPLASVTGLSTASGTNVSGTALNASLAASPVSLSPGVYWVCIEADATAVAGSVTTAALSSGVQATGWLTGGTQAQISTSSTQMGYYLSGTATYGTWPNSSVLTTYTEAASRVPAIQFQVN